MSKEGAKPEEIIIEEWGFRWWATLVQGLFSAIVVQSIGIFLLVAGVFVIAASGIDRFLRVWKLFSGVTN